MIRPLHIHARADTSRNVDGVAVVGSYQSSPPTLRPWRARGRADTAKTKRYVELSLTEAEARKLVADWLNMGLFGRRARVSYSGGEAA